MKDINFFLLFQLQILNFSYGLLFLKLISTRLRKTTVRSNVNSKIVSKRSDYSITYQNSLYSETGQEALVGRGNKKSKY